MQNLATDAARVLFSLSHQIGERTISLKAYNRPHMQKWAIAKYMGY